MLENPSDKVKRQYDAARIVVKRLCRDKKQIDKEFQQIPERYENIKSETTIKKPKKKNQLCTIKVIWKQRWALTRRQRRKSNQMERTHWKSAKRWSDGKRKRQNGKEEI